MVSSNENVLIAKNVFWSKLQSIVDNQYEIEPVTAVDKLTNFYNQSINLKNVSLENRKNNMIFRVKLSSLEEGIENYSCACGYFSEYHAKSLMIFQKL